MKDSSNQKVTFFAILSVTFLITFLADWYVSEKKVEVKKTENPKVNYQKYEKINADSVGVSEVSVQVNGEPCKVTTVQYLVSSKAIPSLKADSFRIIKCKSSEAILP